MSNMGAGLGGALLALGGTSLVGALIGAPVTILATAGLVKASRYCERKANNAAWFDPTAATMYKIAKWACLAFAALVAIKGATFTGACVGGLLFVASLGSPSIAAIGGIAAAIIIGSIALKKVGDQVFA